MIADKKNWKRKIVLFFIVFWFLVQESLLKERSFISKRGNNLLNN